VIKFINIIFKGYIEVLALGFLLICIILGGVYGYKTSELNVVTDTVLGLIIGFGVGIFIDSFVFGVLMILINMDNNIEEIKNNILSIKNGFEVTNFEEINKTIIDRMKKRFEDIEKEKKEKINYM